MSSGKAKQFRRAYRQMGYEEDEVKRRGREDFATYKSLHGPAKAAFNNLLKENLYE